KKHKTERKRHKNRNSNISFVLFVSFLCLLCSVPAFVGQSPKDRSAATLNQYCMTCHNERLRTAGLALTASDLSDIPARAEIWEKVIRKLRTRTMPPAGLPRPDPAGHDALASYLENENDSAAAGRPHPGPKRGPPPL